MLDIFLSLNIVLMLFYTSFNCYALSLNFVQESAADDDDDLDLFGDETEDEKKAAEQREAAKASTKKKESEFNITVIVWKKFFFFPAILLKRIEVWRGDAFVCSDSFCLIHTMSFPRFMPSLHNAKELCLGDIQICI